MSRLTLMTKSLPRSIPAAGGTNPAMRANGAEGMDDGRQWAGDPYAEGMVSDPDEAFAKFTGGGEDTEAWLDRNDDGTLIGWVREGADVFRYSDPEAWAVDVDGAGMSRADAGADPSMVDPAAGGDPAADGTEDMTDENGDPVQGPEGFAEEPDPAAEEPDPTDGLEDPTALPDNTADPNAQQTPAEQAENEYDNPFADLDDEGEPAADEKPTDETPAEDNAEDPDADGDPETDNDNDGDGEPDVEVTDEQDLDENGKPKKKKGQLFGGKVQVKHLPGKHNQEDHGDWADKLPNHHFPGGHRRGSSGSSGSSRSGSADPKGGKPAGAAGDGGTDEKPEPKKAKLDQDTVKALDDDTLTAILENDALYDYETMAAAAKELDRRDDVDGRTRGFAEHTEPGSPERQALFDAVIPDHWSAWVAQGSKGRKPKKNKRAEIEQAYQEHVMAQYQRALEFTNGYFFNNRYKAGTKASREAPDELAFFDGRITRSQFKKYASEELSRFFGDEGGEQRMTFSDFAAEFYPSYAKAKAKVGSRYLTEHG